MRKRSVIYLTVLNLLATAVSVRADTDQKSDKLWPFGLGKFKAEVGTWAEYLHVSTGADPVPLRLSLVGREGNAYWHEISTIVSGVKNVVKLLVTDRSPNLEGLRKIILKNGINPAIEMPAGSLGAMGGLMLLGPALGMGQLGEVPSLEDFRDLGQEVITLKAGRVEARRYRLERPEGRYDVWISDAVPLWGLAKLVFPGGHLELLKYGKGATTEITEKPQRLEIPFLLPPGETPRD